MRDLIFTRKKTSREALNGERGGGGKVSFVVGCVRDGEREREGGKKIR